MEINIRAIENLAKTLLRVEPVYVNYDIVQHPFASSQYFIYGGDLLDMREHYDKWISLMDKEIDRLLSIGIEGYYHLVNLINKPYRLYFIKLSEDYIDDETFAKVLLDVWTTVEFNCHDANVSLDEIRGMARRVRRVFPDRHKELVGEIFKGKDSIILYRGVHDEGIKLKGALSWTLNKEVSEFFANRLRRGKAEIWELGLSIKEKNHILWVIGGAGEEVLLDTRGLQGRFKRIEV